MKKVIFHLNNLYSEIWQKYSPNSWPYDSQNLGLLSSIALYLIPSTFKQRWYGVGTVYNTKEYHYK